MQASEPLPQVDAQAITQCLNCGRPESEHILVMGRPKFDEWLNPQENWVPICPTSVYRKLPV